MARVYRALDEDTSQTVALKVLKPQYQSDTKLAARFEREALSMARVRHENVVRILGVPHAEDISAISMELLTGGSLRSRLDLLERGSERFSVDEAIELAAQAARGLGAAHHVGVVHRDVKPSNLLFDDHGAIKVADFGAILVLEQTTFLTGVGQQIGTPRYMSPEQCKGERVTPASDIYSLGTTLFEMLVGRLPFMVEEASPFAIMLKHLSEPAPDPRLWREDIPDWLAVAVLRCLEKRPRDRYQSGSELAEALTSGATPPQAVAAPSQAADRTVDLAMLRAQLQELPQLAIVYWACRCARRVQDLNRDPRVERALEMAEASVLEPSTGTPTQTLSNALSRIRTLRLASLKAAYADESTPASPEATEAARAAAAAASCAAARCIDDAAADAAFAARSAIAALRGANRSIQPFWRAARRDYQRLRQAGLGEAGTIGQPIPPSLLDEV
jgi:serine/threonine-protein kinase